MDADLNRNWLFGAVAILLVLAVVTALFVFPLSPGSTDAPFELSSAEPYVSSGAISDEDDGLLIAHEATVLADDEAHLSFEYENGTVDQFYDNGTVYTKHETHVDNEDWMDSTAPDEAEVIHAEQHGETLVRITSERDTVGHGEMTFVRSQTRHLLAATEYEQVDERDGLTVYEPSSTWTELDSQTIRVSPESGQLGIDQQTGILREASVRLTLTDSSSYGEYFFRESNSSTVDIQYEYDPDPDIEAVETPMWVEQCVEGNRCEF